jgi:hypothetical protein
MNVSPVPHRCHGAYVDATRPDERLCLKVKTRIRCRIAFSFCVLVTSGYFFDGMPFAITAVDSFIEA